MIRRFTTIFAASLALLSTLEPATCFAAAAPAPNRDELERPRFVRKEIKRFVIGARNGTTTTGPEAGNGPAGDRPSTTSPLDTLTDSLTTSAVAETPTHTQSDQLGDHSGQTTTDHSTSSSSSLDITSDHGTTPEIASTAAAASSTHASSHSQESTTQGPPSPATQSDSSTANTNTDTTGATSNTGKTNTDTVKQSTPSKSQTLDTSPVDTGLGLPTTNPFTKSSGTQNTETNTGQSASSSQSGEQGPGGISSVLSPVIVPSVTPPIGKGPTKQTDTQSPSSGPEASPSHSTNLNGQSVSHELGVTPVQSQSSVSQTTLPNVPAGAPSVTPVQPQSSVSKTTLPNVPAGAPSVTLVQPQSSVSQTTLPNVPGAPSDIPIQDQSSASQTTLSNAQGGVSSVTPIQPDTKPASSTGGAATTLPPGGNNNQSPIAEPTVTPTHAAESILPSLTLPAHGDTTAAAYTAASATDTNTSNGNAVVGLPGAQSSGKGHAAASNTGAAETTIAGSVSPAQDVHLPIPTGPALYTALTIALGSVPGDGSTMLPNGMVVPTAAQTTNGGSLPLGSTLSNGLVPISGLPGALSATVPAAAQTTNGGSLPPGSTLSDGLLVPVVPTAAVSMSAQPTASLQGGLPPGSTLSDGLLVPVVSTAAVHTAAPPSVASEGSPSLGLTLSDGLIVSISHTAVALPSTVPTANNPGVPARLTLSDGLLESISTAAALPTLPPLTYSNGDIIPAASATVPVAPILSEASHSFIPVLTNSDGSIIPNPAVATNTNLPSNPVSPIIPTESSVNLVPNPAAATNSALPPFVPAVTDSNGSILPNPTAATNTALAPIVPTSLVPTVAAPTGTVLNTGVPLPAATTNAAIPASTGPIVGSSTLSNGAVVPITAGGTLGSSTQSNGNVVPITAAAASAASGSTTLPNGSVVPISNAPAQASTPLPNGSVASVQDTSQGVPAVAQPSTVAPAVQSFPTDAKGPFTQQPTGYDSLTTQSIPTNIIVQPSISGSGAASSTGSIATGLPTGVPLVLYPPQGPKEQPENTDMIQIGFKYPLNYDFVWTHDESQQQIFKYLPLGISYGLNIDPSNVTMQTLRAWDTTRDLHYITTLALAWIPSGLVDTLSLLVQTQTSRFYTNPDSSTNTLLSMINNAIPIPADNSTDGGSTPYGSQPTSSTGEKTKGSPFGGDIGDTQPVRPSSIGIGVGVAAGAAAYGAAMFFVARRYKKRRQSHGRSPSMFNSPVMSHIGPDAGAGAALMSGGIDRSISPYHDEDGRAGSRGSGRSGSTGRQQISAPVMAENSLGWN